MSARILIVEDNPTNMELMTYLVSSHGYEVTPATGGEEGVRVALGGSVDLVLCDIQLPGELDGLGVVRRLKQELSNKRLPIIAVTALAMVGDRDRIMAAGFDGYIPKPIEPRTFVHQLETHLPEHARSQVKLGNAEKHRGNAHQILGIGTRHRILIVDDKPTNLAYLQDTLTMSGFRVDVAKSCTEALGIARSHPPDLVLSDFHLEGELGSTLLEQMRADEALHKTPFIFLSATSKRQELVEDARAQGAQAFLFRPLSPELLIQAVETHLDGAEEQG